jgi:sulfide dehydrogenase cytochrome subunit
MAHSCAACHGTNGQLGDESFAPLAGMPAGQFVKTMIDFREGRRPATLMGHVAKGFSDEDLKGMGAFFEAQGAQR